jgi:hypothetical protein
MRLFIFLFFGLFLFFVLRLFCSSLIIFLIVSGHINFFSVMICLMMIDCDLHVNITFLQPSNG